jgi:hypothetical protein
MRKVKGVLFTGESGEDYFFEIYPKGTTFKNIGAVYIFIKKILNSSGKPSYEPLYIGESSELGERIKNHNKEKCVEKNGYTHICILPIEEEKHRLEIESDLIHKCNTPCNKQ